MNLIEQQLNALEDAGINVLDWQSALMAAMDFEYTELAIFIARYEDEYYRLVSKGDEFDT